MYPHFFDKLIPGWFDKRLRWRRFAPEHVDRTILICPSPEFIANLPGGKVPDRTDFVTMTPFDRREVWHSVVTACQALADDLREVLDGERMAARVEPL